MIRNTQNTLSHTHISNKFHFSMANSKSQTNFTDKHSELTNTQNKNNKFMRQQKTHPEKKSQTNKHTHERNFSENL